MKLIAYSCRKDELPFFQLYGEKYGVELVLCPHKPTLDNADLAKGCQGVSVVTTPIGASLIDRWRQLGVKVISTRTVGYEHVDYQYAEKLGITVSNVSYSADTVAEYTVMSILMALRKMKAILSRCQGQDYTLAHVRGRELSRLTVGVIGTGEIGERVIRDLRGFGCKLLACSRHQKLEVKRFATYVPLDQLFRECDIITLHLPATDATFHLIDQEAINQMKDGVVIVNTARGSLVDTKALIQGLESGKVGAAALDVLEQEGGIYYRDFKYQPVGHHQMAILQAMPNVVMTPHTAFFTDEAVGDMIKYSIFSCLITLAGNENPWKVNDVPLAGSFGQINGTERLDKMLEETMRNEIMVNETVKERMNALRCLMRECRMDAYLIPTADFHESEYVGDYFKCREYITGFTGSAGTAVITQEEACLWTDGRYFVQAARELAGTGVILQRMGQEGVPTVEEYLEKVVPERGCLGFDGRVVNAKMGEELEERLSRVKATIAYDQDMVGRIWKDRPPLSKEPVWILDEAYTGKPASQKIADLLEEMAKLGAGIHMITTLDDVAWLLNLRGNDIACTPVALAYMIVTDDPQVELFIQEEALDEKVKSYLDRLGVTVRPYSQVVDYSREYFNEVILLEKAKTNYAIRKSLEDSNRIIDQMNPTSLAKAMKNPVEVENMRKIHVKDGVALTKFLYWLKKNIGKVPMTEDGVAERLDEMRSQVPGNLGPSFPTISAYGKNAAMCHYHARPGEGSQLKPQGLYLVDSGGQYLEGTTDVTRTIALGPITQEEREHFTIVAASMLRLGAVKFAHGCGGMTLDYVAREPFWSRGLNFDHGTGHGVGYLLGVHERPNGMRWKAVKERQDTWVFEEGMVTSDEPGIYIEGSHGIRTENLMLCKKGLKTQYGQFMEFEFLTFVPIDLDAIDKSLMEPKDVELLNQYHKQVYEKISPYLSKEEADWLKECTREI